MKKFLYSVYDKQTYVFQNPFVQLNDNVAIRDFVHAIRDPQLSTSIYPEDLILYRVAEYDDATGQLAACEPLKIATGIQFLDPQA